MKQSNFFTNAKAVGLIFLFAPAAVIAQPEDSSLDAPTVYATIEFDDQGCPKTGAINTNKVTMGRPGQKILFKANPLMDNSGEYNDFELTFDPFVGRTEESTRGELLTRPLSVNSTPKKHQQGQATFKFKYTIYSEGCPEVDPMIIIDR